MWREVKWLGCVMMYVYCNVVCIVVGCDWML